MPFANNNLPTEAIPCMRLQCQRSAALLSIGLRLQVNKENSPFLKRASEFASLNQEWVCVRRWTQYKFWRIEGNGARRARYGETTAIVSLITWLIPRVSGISHHILLGIYIVLGRFQLPRFVKLFFSAILRQENQIFAMNILFISSPQAQ